MKNNIEAAMLSEIKELGYSEFRIDEFNSHGNLQKSTTYSRPHFAIRKMLGFTGGKYFPIYQGSEMMNAAGRKMRISMN